VQKIVYWYCTVTKRNETVRKFLVLFEVCDKSHEVIYECKNADEAEDIFRSEFGFDCVYIDQICPVDDNMQKLYTGLINVSKLKA
jgi:hypothetical protein